MDETCYGFVHSELEIKMLILYIISRLPAPANLNQLSDVAMSCDGGFTYFDFTDALASLVKLEHIDEKDGKYIITKKGRETGEETESDVPYSVRKRAERLSAKLAQELRREELIKTEVKPRKGGGFTVSLSISDNSGELFSTSFLIGSEEQANKVVKRFRKNAEEIFPELVGRLLGEI